MKSAYSFLQFHEYVCPERTTYLVMSHFLIISGSKFATAINGATLVLSVPDRYRWLYVHIHVWTLLFSISSLYQ